MGAPSPEYDPAQVTVPLSSPMALAGSSIYQENCAPLPRPRRAWAMVRLPQDLSGTTHCICRSCRDEWSQPGTDVFHHQVWPHAKDDAAMAADVLTTARSGMRLPLPGACTRSSRQLTAGQGTLQRQVVPAVMVKPARAMDLRPKARSSTSPIHQYAIFQSQADWQSGWQAEHPQTRPGMVRRGSRAASWNISAPSAICRLGNRPISREPA